MSGVAIPEDLRYTTDHEWVQLHGIRARIGITDYAQHALGDVVFVGVPATGLSVAAGDTVTEIESTKSVSDLYAPVSGSVVATNESLATEPHALNTDPYGSGWICEIEMSDPAEWNTLLDAGGYRSIVEG